MGKTRREVDSLGEVEIPSEAYYGAQTMRAIGNFSISGIPISHLSQIIQGLVLVKKAAVLANARLGDIPVNKATAIAAACDDIIVGDLTDAFPIDVFQGGAGTSTNMNTNEVIGTVPRAWRSPSQGERRILARKMACTNCRGCVRRLEDLTRLSHAN